MCCQWIIIFFFPLILLGWPHWIMCLHLTLSLASSFVTPLNLWATIKTIHNSWFWFLWWVFFFRKINNRLLFSRLGLRKWTVIMSHMPAASWSVSAPYQRVILSHGSVIQPCLQLPTWPKYTNTPTCTCVRTAASSSSLTSCCRHLTLIKVTGSVHVKSNLIFPSPRWAQNPRLGAAGCK